MAGGIGKSRGVADRAGLVWGWGYIKQHVKVDCKGLEIERTASAG